MEEFSPGDVVEVTQVVRPGAPPRDTTWRLPEGLGIPGTRATSSTRLVNSRPAKRALNSTLGAGVVDMESLTFVDKGLELGWRFGIVRAISDGLDDTLPPGCDRWVDHRGRVSLPAVAASVIRSPSLVGRMKQMNRLTTDVMARLADVLGQATSEPIR